MGSHQTAVQITLTLDWKWAELMIMAYLSPVRGLLGEMQKLDRNFRTTHLVTYTNTASE